MARNKKFDRKEVIEKAVILFWEKGYHACSMQDLVAGLGINRASMYDTFGNKSGLYVEALSFYHLQNKNKTADFLYQQVFVRQGLYLRFQEVIKDSEGPTGVFGCFLQNAICEMDPQDQGMRQMLTQFVHEQEQAYYNYLEYGQVQGQISPYKDIKFLAKQLFELEMNIKLALKLRQSQELILLHVEKVLATLA